VTRCDLIPPKHTAAAIQSGCRGPASTLSIAEVDFEVGCADGPRAEGELRSSCSLTRALRRQARGLVADATNSKKPEIPCLIGHPQSFWWASSPPAPGAPEIKPYGPGGYVTLTAEGFRKHFGQDLAADEVALLHATQGPFAQGSNDEKITTAAWREKPTWFVIGRDDHMLLSELEKATADKLNAKTLVLESSRLPMLSQPAEVADFVQQAALQSASAE
jgi:hypothetical protein